MKIKRLNIIIIIVIVLTAGASWFFWRQREIVVSRNNLTAEEIQSYGERRRELENKLNDSKDLDPNLHGNLLLQLGRTEYILGNLSKAEKDFKQGIKVDPVSYDQYLGLGDVYIDMDRYQKAEQAYWNAVEAVPEEASAYQKLVFLFKRYFPGRAGDLDNIYKQAVENSGNVDLMREYAKFLEDRREYRKSWVYWQDVVFYSPDDNAAKAAVANLEKILGIESQ